MENMKETAFSIPTCLSTPLNILICIFNFVSGQPYSFLPPLDPDVPQPTILNDGETFRANLGDTLTLPCNVKDLGPMVLIWKKATRVLTAGGMKIKKDERFTLRGTDLQIKNIEPEDGGEYSCEIEADEEYPVAIKHRLEVLSK